MVTKSSDSLLKRKVDNLQFLAHEFFLFLEKVRLALDIDDGAVMQNAIQDGGGNTGKGLVSLGEGLIGRKLVPPKQKATQAAPPGLQYIRVSNTRTYPPRHRPQPPACRGGTPEADSWRIPAGRWC